MNVALVYDWVDSWGGAERVLLALHELFPHAPLFTSIYNRKKAPWAQVFNIHTSFLQKLPFAKNHHEWFTVLRPLAFELFDFSRYDLVISVTSAEAKGIITKPGTTHICYCLTPTRYLWSQYHTYFANKLLKVVTSPVVSCLRAYDQVAAQRPDHYIAISNEVKLRIKHYYGRESEVIYPPADKVSDDVQMPVRPIDGEFFLVVSRLVSYKRVDVAIDACTLVNKRLVIVGTGSKKHHLQSIANDSITFISDLTDRQLSWYYQHCSALIAPQDEDFGLTAVEAQMYGSPVIAYQGGGNLETVIEGRTGAFFKPQTKDALANVLKTFHRKKYRAADCISNAKRFSKERFKKELVDFIAKKTT